jgi:hypothetical protein
MKFFSKKNNSEILAKGLTYKKNQAENNANLKELLIKEQFNFCAYTEKYFDELDSVEVEHFDSSQKYQDDYYNYYAVLRKPNLYKKDENYKNASFFQSLFFQNKEVLENRIKYVKGAFVFEEINPNDQEVKDFINFLGINNPDLYTIRKNHIKKLQFIFSFLNESEKIQFFKTHRTELSFITLLEEELEMDLSVFYM